MSRTKEEMREARQRKIEHRRHLLSHLDHAGRSAGADFGAAYMPATVGQCPFVLVCDRHGAAACALPPDLSDAAIANQILDLLRRRLLGLRLTDSCIIFRPGMALSARPAEACTTSPGKRLSSTGGTTICLRFSGWA